MLSRSGRSGLAPNSTTHSPQDIMQSFSHSWPQYLHWQKRNIVPILTNSQIYRGRLNEEMNVQQFRNRDYEASQLTGPQKNADFCSSNLSLTPLQSMAPASTYPLISSATICRSTASSLDYFLGCRTIIFISYIFVFIYFQPFISKQF